LRTVQLLGIGGFLFITGGAIALTVITDHGNHDAPMGFFFACAGFITLWLIVRRLLKMLDAPQPISLPTPMQAPIQMPERGTTQQLPPMDTMPYSVVEEKTRQFER
jgi:hypothetical protein